jgi:HTH-type transcriptional regulator / antitoxin HigA
MPVMTMDGKKYGRLLARHLPALIETDEEQDRLAEELVHLMGKGELSAEERRLGDLLDHLLVEYEQRQRAAHPRRRPSPLRMLENVMEFKELRQADLVDVFGSPSRVSEVLSGKRKINLGQARRLADRFHMDVAIFLD